jgi:thiol-disulfide isomerase/thioredoxin
LRAEGLVEIVLRLVLAVVLASAALAKLAAPRASIDALASFGFGDGPLRPVGWAVLIAVELALAIAVALGSDAAAYAAAALMTMFAALTVAALLRGLGVALLACAALAVALLALAREVGMLRLQVGTQGALEITGEGPEIGAHADGLAERIGRNGADLGLAVFTSEGCGICQSLEPAIDNVAKDPRVAVATFDEAAEAELWRSLGIPGSPFALALNREGMVLAKGTFNNLAQLESVLATAERREHAVGA